MARKILTEAKQKALYVNTVYGRAVVRLALERLLSDATAGIVEPPLTPEFLEEARTLVERLKAREA